MKHIKNLVVTTAIILGVSQMIHAENVLSIVSGDKQVVQRLGEDVGDGTATFEALTVGVKDRAGKPVPNLKIKFQGGSVIPAGMAYQFESRGVDGSTFVTSDNSGLAVLNKLSNGKSIYAYYATGKLPILVTAEDCNQVTFDLTVTDPPPIPAIAGAKMEILAGNNQKVKRRTIFDENAPLKVEGDQEPQSAISETAFALFDPLQVTVKDSAGKPLAGVRVRFESGAGKPTGMSVQLEPCGFEYSTITTGEDGVATLDRMQGKSVRAYYGDGPITIVASYGPEKATFKLTVGE